MGSIQVVIVLVMQFRNMIGRKISVEYRLVAWLTYATNIFTFAKISRVTIKLYHW